MKAEDPQQEEKLRRLLRLKRYEQPPEGFAEEFLEKFQRRQRSELLRRSSLSIFRERLTEWFHGLRRPAVIWGAASVYASVMLALWLLPRPVPQNGTAVLLPGGIVTTTTTVDYQPNGATHPVSTQTPIPAAPSNSVPPGKRRTVIQEQDNKEIIGPDHTAPKSEDEKLRDL